MEYNVKIRHKHHHPILKYPDNIFYSRKNIITLKKMIFPKISDDKIPHLMIDDESIKFITFHSSAQEITNVIMNNLNDFPCSTQLHDDIWNEMTSENKMKQLIITEMTAGVGGNVLNFAKYFKQVNAIEINSTRFEYLQKNIELYECANVNCYNDDSLNFLIGNDDIVQDIIFFDPPWGGKNYKLFTNLRLKFGKYSIENVCKILFQQDKNKMIILKLPNNYDFNYIDDELKNYKIIKCILDRMTILIVKNYPK